MATMKAAPCCAACHSTSFAQTQVTPRGANFPVALVHCAQCGAVVGALDYLPVGTRLEELQQAMAELQSQLRRLRG